MSQGKFSQPRPHREEEREIESAFRQITGQDPAPQRPAYPKPDPAPQSQPDFFDLIPEDSDLLLDLPPEPQPEPEPDFLDKMLDFWGRNKQMVLVGLCAAALLLILGIVAVFLLSGRDPYDGKILDNVAIGTVDVGGMTKSEATSALKQLGIVYSQTDLTVNFGTTALHLAPKDTGASLDVKAAVEAAYSYGRTGTKEEQAAAAQNVQKEPYILGLLPYLNLNEEYILSTLTTYAQDIGSTLTQTSYGLEGPQPELSADKFDENAPGQTLVITMGTPGIGFDVNAVYKDVLDAYSLTVFQVSVESVNDVAQPDPIDLEAIYEEFYIAPQDARVDMQTFEPIPGSYGYGFSLETAQRLLDAAQFGEVLRIPMEYIAPEVLDEAILFRDVLGEGRTPHTNNQNRNTNLKLACEALNGKVLNPGEVLSFNETLGQRTAAKGYKEAAAYSSGEVVESLGGGICQVSSTLYYSALLADLDIVARTNHSYVSNYIDYGMDATVSWGSPDFKFRNSTNYPIKIEAWVADGYVNVRILGTAERDYYIEMHYEITNTYQPETEYKDFPYDNPEGYKDGDVIKNGTVGYYVKTYKLKYSTENGKLLSKDFAANSQYRVVNKVVARVAPEPTQAPTVPTTVPTTPPTVPPTVPPTQPQPEVPATTPPTQPPTVPTQAPVAEPEVTVPPTAAPTQAPETPPPPVQTEVPVQEEVPAA